MNTENDLPPDWDGLVGFTTQRRGPDGKPIGKRLTFLPESFVIEPLRCCCGQITSRLSICPVHPKATRVFPPGKRKVDSKESDEG